MDEIEETAVAVMDAIEEVEAVLDDDVNLTVTSRRFGERAFVSATVWVEED